MVGWVGGVGFRQAGGRPKFGSAIALDSLFCLVFLISDLVGFQHGDGD